MRVGDAHPLQRLLDIRILARLALGERAHVAHPVLHPLVGRRLAQHRGGRPQPLDRDQRLDRIGKYAGRCSATPAPSEWPISVTGPPAIAFIKLVEIEHVIDHRVAAADRPVGIAMAAKVGRDQMEMPAQLERDPVPVAAMVASAVHQDRHRLVRVAPVDVVKLEPLGIEVVRRGPNNIGDNIRHGASSGRAQRP